MSDNCEYLEDFCSECSALGDDWFINEDGELESMCPYCELYKLTSEVDDE